jgi:hypothetical protein
MKKGYLRNVVNEAYVTGQSNRFAIDICFRRKGDEMSTRQEKHTIAEDIINDLESSSYFEGNDVKVEEHGDTLSNGCAMLELTLTSTGNLIPEVVKRAIMQGGVLPSAGYQVHVYSY